MYTTSIDVVIALNIPKINIEKNYIFEQDIFPNELNVGCAPCT